MALLEVEDVHVYYGKVEALRGISINVGQGEIVALLGSNGAGKTTTLRAISGMRRVTGGRIRFAGRDISGLRTHQIVGQGLSHVPEGRRLFVNLTVDENLTLGAYLDRRDSSGVRSRRERVYGLFPRLLERQHQLAGTLSGGEQQMLAIGRALMSQPQFLGLDEPSMGLSPVMVRSIFELIQQVRASGVAILLVEQNARQALSVADRGYVLETGKIVLQGAGEQLSRDPRVVSAYLGGFDVISAEPPSAPTSDHQEG
jgi:branched-chain amino acid transport system ATP-binding protein